MAIKNIIADFLLVLAVSVGTLSLLGEVTLDFMLLPARINWLIYVLFCYFLRYGLSFPGNLRLSENPLARLFIIIIFWEGVQALMLGRNIGFTYLVQGFTYIVILAYFVKSTDGEHGISRLIKPYNLYYIASFIIIFITVILIVMGQLSPTDNPITENALMNNNISTGSYYYWPGHLSVVNLSTRLDIFNIPVLCGFSHEPHVLAQSIFPAFFLLLYTFKDKKIIYKGLLIFSLLFIILFSFSTTSLITLSIILILTFFIHSGVRGRQKILFFVFLIALLFFANKYGISDQIISNSSNKLSGADHSKDYSTNLLMYGLTPSGIIGEGIYPGADSKGQYSSGNVGLISCILCNITYALFVIKSFKNFRSKNELCHYIGLSALYFSIHSLKLGCLIYNYPMMFFMIYILSYSEQIRKKTATNSLLYE